MLGWYRVLYYVHIYKFPSVLHSHLLITYWSFISLFILIFDNYSPSWVSYLRNSSSSPSWLFFFFAFVAFHLLSICLRGTSTIPRRLLRLVYEYSYEYIVLVFRFRPRLTSLSAPHNESQPAASPKLFSQLNTWCRVHSHLTSRGPSEAAEWTTLRASISCDFVFGSLRASQSSVATARSILSLWHLEQIVAAYLFTLHPPKQFLQQTYSYRAILIAAAVLYERVWSVSRQLACSQFCIDLYTFNRRCLRIFKAGVAVPFVVLSSFGFVCLQSSCTERFRLPILSGSLILSRPPTVVCFVLHRRRPSCSSSYTVVDWNLSSEFIPLCFLSQFWALFIKY